jgi:hypothetical protein
LAEKSPRSESNGADNEACSGAENEGGGDGCENLDILEQEKLTWKKEKRRKQNREAQRRRRDRLMNQHRQKQAELDGPVAGVISRGPGMDTANNQQVAYNRHGMMTGAGGMDLFSAANGMQLGAKDDQFAGGVRNPATRYSGDLGTGGQLPCNMSMLQKQLSFGAGIAGGMQGWANYNTMHGNLINQDPQTYGHVQQHAHAQQALSGQHSLGGQVAQRQGQAGGGGINYPRRGESFNFGSNLNSLTTPMPMNKANTNSVPIQGANLNSSFWDTSNAHAVFNDKLAITPAATQLNNHASFHASGLSVLGGMGSLTNQNSFTMGSGMTGLGTAQHNNTAALGNIGGIVKQESFAMDPLLKSSTFMPMDFAGLLRQDSNRQVSA